MLKHNFRSISTVVFKSNEWKIDLYLFPYVTIIFILPAVFTEESATESVGGYLRWFLIKLSAVLFAYLIYLKIYHLLTIRNRNNLRFYEIFAIGAFGGAVSGLLTALIISLTKFVSTDNSLVSQLIGPATTGGVWLPITCASSVSYKKISDLYQTLNSQFNSKITEEIHKSDLFKEAVVNKDRITTEQIITIIKSNKDYSAAAHDLEQISSKKERFKSLKIKRIRNIFNILGRGNNIFKISVKVAPLNPVLFTLVMTSVILFGVIQNNPTISGLIVITYIATYTYIFHRLQVFFYEKYDNWFWLSIVCDVACLLSFTLTGFLLDRFTNLTIYYNSVLISNVLVIFLYILIYLTGQITQSATISYRQQRLKFEEYLNSESFKLKVFNQEVLDDSMKWAQLIHGKVQTRFIAASGDNSAAGRQNLISDINRAIVDELEHSGVSENDAALIIERITSPWSAVISINSVISKDLTNTALPEGAATKLEQVVEEVITNAVKHGAAERIWLELSMESDKSLLLQIKNDGKAVETKRKSLGTSLFDKAGVWSLSNVDSYVIFKMVINL
jgi:signal transduction histidine kinase